MTEKSKNSSPATAASPDTWWQRARKPTISFLCAGYLVTTIIWLWPKSPVQQALVSTYKPFYNFFGLWQGWNVFGPKLRAINYHTTAIITYADGTTELWEVPRMNKLSYWERFCREKWRKWGDDTMPWPAYGELWPDTARFIARMHNNPANPPKLISLTLHWVDIPKPPDICPREHLPEHTGYYTFFVYPVAPEDLKT